MPSASERLGSDGMAGSSGCTDNASRTAMVGSMHGNEPMAVAVPGCTWEIMNYSPTFIDAPPLRTGSTLA